MTSKMWNQRLILQRCALAASLIIVQPLSTRGDEPRRERALPPKWTSEETSVFFENALTEGLQGPRPNRLGRPDERPAADGETILGNFSVARSDPTPNSWRSLISAESLEDLLVVRPHLAGCAEHFIEKTARVVVCEVVAHC